MAEFAVGDRIVFGNQKKNKEVFDISIGRIYEVIEYESSCLAFIDDAGDFSYAGIHRGSIGKATKIID